MSRISKKNDVFYHAFEEMGHALPEVAAQFKDIIERWPDSEADVTIMSAWERRCDEICAGVIIELNRSFITPFDREDINQIIRTMDEVVDQMEECAVRFSSYKVHAMVPEAAQMAELLFEACHALDVLMQHLSQFKKDPVVMQQILTVSKLEDKGDTVHRNGIAAVFEHPADPIHTLKWKSLLDTMEAALDTCKLVANQVQSVVMKNA